MARIESANVPAVAQETEQERAFGPLSVDWLMTDAAVHLARGELNEALADIGQARAGEQSGLFVSCADDIIFAQAGEKHPEIAAACATEAAVPAP